MSDDDFITAFEACTLQEFHHAHHVRAAFLYLCRYPALDALRRFCESRMKFATANGKPNLYHETITWAFLLLIREPWRARLGSREASQPGMNPRSTTPTC